MVESTSSTLYVHVPFCVVKCGYCDFNSYVVEDTAVVDRFLAALELELRTRAPTAPTSIFLGGGTPTHLDEHRFARLLEIVADCVDPAACAEFTIEANPESVTAAKARLAREHGVDRVSIGAQSFDAERLRFLDRAHDAAAIGRAVTAFRNAGFTNLSLDLIYGTPGHDVAAWSAELDQALAFEPEHLSCYELTFEPGTRLTHALENGQVAPNDDTHGRQLFERTREQLLDAGFAAYETSNFARDGRICRHNDHYWLQGDYVGVGPGAASHERGWRGTNLKPVDAWARAVESNLPATGEAETLTRAQRAAEAMWLGLRRTDGVDPRAVERRTGVDPTARFASVVDEHLAAGRLERNGSDLRLTPAGRLFADSVGQAFLVHA